MNVQESVKLWGWRGKRPQSLEEAEKTLAESESLPERDRLRYIGWLGKPPTARECQKCKAPIGYIGRLLQWLAISPHRCVDSTTIWQPIETAPKDGTPIYTYAPDAVPRHRVLAGGWRRGKWRHDWKEPTYWMPYHDDPLIDATQLPLPDGQIPVPRGTT